ncbi:hypothetical protein D0Y65_041004 [Glycine soja]|nr:hypothetical protein D0Y65_041004 [Glycine soja]
MEKTIIPRALVVQYLLAKGLRKKSASCYTPFVVSEKEFMEKYVIRFKEDTHQLLKLYQEKKKLFKEKGMMVQHLEEVLASGEPWYNGKGLHHDSVQIIVACVHRYATASVSHGNDIDAKRVQQENTRKGLKLGQNPSYSQPSSSYLTNKLGRFNPINMLNTLLCKCITFAATSRYPLFHHYPLPFSLRFYTTTTSNSRSFAVSYLIHNFGFSPESASKVSENHKIYFRTPEKPESVIRFFRDHGFSDSQINNMVRRVPRLISCNPCKRVLPKFEFLLSKGVSSSEIVDLISKYPLMLTRSLKNFIVPTYELVYRFLQSDKNTVACMFANSSVFGSGYLVAHNVSVMLKNGLSESNIARLLRYRSKAVFRATDILKVVREVKDLGFDPSKVAFVMALLAIKRYDQNLWKEKVDVFKKWGWSDETFLEAFRRHPHCMLTSTDKINIVMNFWVNQMGWDALALVKGPKIFGLSMEKTIIPRASIVQLLLEKGLRKRSASITCPIMIPEKRFLNRFIKCFKEESSDLLKLYAEKLNLAYSREKSGMLCTK